MSSLEGEARMAAVASDRRSLEQRSETRDGMRIDWNVPIVCSENMYQAMRRLGKPTQLVVYPGEHHGIRRPSYQKDRLERYLAWYGKYVKGESAPTPAS